MEEAAKTAKQSAETVSKGGEKLGRTAAFKALSQVSWTLGPAAKGALGSGRSEAQSQSSHLGAQPRRGLAMPRGVQTGEVGPLQVPGPRSPPGWEGGHVTALGSCRSVNAL